ncbi:tetratricopeptide repeat protein 12 [Phthorimaea operculella]|nr:tetratricopeptide repeat protein 12 [Phthorimaea operculella]
MSVKKNMINQVLNDPKDIALNEEWNNFVKRIGEVTNLVKDLSSGDKERAEAAKVMADKYLEGKVILDENVQMTVKSDRTVINQKAFKNMGKQNAAEMDKESWMDAVSKDAEQRAADRKVRKERADTFKTMAMKAFNRGEYERALSCYNNAIEQVKDNAMLYCDRALTNIKLGNFEKVSKERADTFKTMAMKAFNRGEYERALSCYNKGIEQVKENAMLYCDRAHPKVSKARADSFKTIIAMKAFNRGEYKALFCYNNSIEQVKDNAMLYCDRVLTNIKLGNFEKVFDDVHWAQRINENSFKARLYRAKAHKELGQIDKLEECRKELDEKFPEHKELVQYFLDKQVKVPEEEEEVKDTILI